MTLRDASLQVYEKKLHAYSFMYFAFIFSEHIVITSSEEAFKLREYFFFQEI